MLSLLSRRCLPQSIQRSFTNRYSFSTAPKWLFFGDQDPANLIYLQSSTPTPTLSFVQKLSYISPSSLYNHLDVYTRQLLFTFADDLNWGLPLSIVAISSLFKLVYLYPALKVQVISFKTQKMRPLQNLYMERMKTAQMTGNKMLMKQARQEFNDARKKHGITNKPAFINMTQIPIMITWFLSLRYITTLPEVFPAIQSTPFLWIGDLSAFDPYFILPTIAALLSSYSIAFSPNLSRSTATFPFMQPIIKYLKFMPFVSLPITGTFPAALNLYWCTLAAWQAIQTLLINTTVVKKWLGENEEAAKKQTIVKVVWDEEDDGDKDRKDGHANNSHKDTQQKSIMAAQPSNQSTKSPSTVKVVSQRPKKSKETVTDTVKQ